MLVQSSITLQIVKQQVFLIATLWEPCIGMVCWYSPTSVMKALVHSYLIWTSHCHLYYVSPMPNNPFDVWKGDFDWVVIRWVGGQEFIPHPASANVNYGHMHRDCMYLPSGDHIENVRTFVNMAVIHDDDGVWLSLRRWGKGFISSTIRATPQWRSQAFHIVWALYDVDIEDPIQRQRW